MGYSGDGGQATAAEIGFSDGGLTFDNAGNLYFADLSHIRKITTAGIISTICGNATKGYTGDGGQATAAQVSDPSGLVFDATGNMYIADRNTNVIRMINTAGIITTIAGDTTGTYNTGGGSYSGDGGAATAAQMSWPSDVVLDGQGNLYIADFNNNRIRKVTFGSTAGVEQITNNKTEVVIYPNPSTGSINITSTSNIDAIKVSDMLGQIVYEAKPHNTTTTLTIDDVGVYFITITNGTAINTKKVIVSK